MNTPIPYVDFYTKNSISPVSQDISNLNRHFTRRKALYRHLGIPASLLYGKKILEIGPGSGHNALFTLSCKPAYYKLIDGNSVGVEETTNRLSLYREEHSINTELDIELSLIENFDTSERFDLVLCEGMLPWQKDPVEIFKKILRFTKPEGIAVITCCDSVSILSDMLRRVMGQALSNANLSPMEQALQLVPFFKPHFANLSGMSRPLSDWILDNVIQPFYGKNFSIHDAVSAAENLADAYGSSPHFFTDWRWYKQIYQPSNDTNKIIKEQYWQHLHNLLDFEFVFPPACKNQNLQIFNHAEEFTALALEFQISRDIKVLSEMATPINNINRILEHIGPETLTTRQRLVEASEILTAISQGKSERVPARNFECFFGRGQQYISFILH